MLRFGGDAPELVRAIGFLDDLLADEAWVLVAVGPTKKEVRTFAPRAPADMREVKDWIARQRSQRRRVLVLLATPTHALVTSPTTRHIRSVKFVTIAVAASDAPALEALRYPPALITRDGATLYAGWRFTEAVTVDRAREAEKQILNQLPGKSLGFFFPVPTGHWDFDKARFVFPTDFRSAAKKESAGPSEARIVEKPELLVLGSQLKIEPVSWLMPNFVEAGVFTLLGGNPGAGKSQIACKLIGTLTSGGVWPDGTKAEIGSAIIGEYEDDPNKIVIPRLKAAGANVGHVAFCPFLDLSKEIGKLIEIIRGMKVLGLPPVRLMVFSPILTCFGETTTDENTVRMRLRPLLTLAAQEEIAVLGITHLAEDGKKAAFAGAKGFVRASRAAWIAAVNEADPEIIVKRKQRLVYAHKINNAPDGAFLYYRIRGATVDGAPTSHIVWEQSSAAPDQGGRGRSSGSGREGETPVFDREPRQKPIAPATARCMEWLRAYLAASPRLATDIKTDAGEAGFSTGTLYNAADALGIRRSSDGASVTEAKTWSLPPDLGGSL